MAVTLSGSSSSTKRSVSASWTVMSSTTPPPAAGVVDAPALQVRRQKDGVEHAGEKRLADAAILDRLPHGPVRAGITQVMVGGHDHACRAACLDHLLGIRERQGQRLLAEHVLAGLGGRQGLGFMMLVRGGDVDGVDAAAEQLVERCRRLRDSLLAGIGVAPRLVARHDGHHVVAGRTDRADHPFLGDRRRADDSPP